MAYIIQHVLQGFIVKNIEDESTETKNLSHILKKMYKPFETASQINEELQITITNEMVQFVKKFKVLNHTSGIR